MRSTDWLSHHRLAIYRYEYLGTNVIRIYSSKILKPEVVKFTISFL